jgi:hypothetical protein
LVISGQGTLVSPTDFRDNSFLKNQVSQSNTSDNATCELWKEHFVDADAAATFLSLSRKHLLKLARLRRIPAYPITFGTRALWRFRISELEKWIIGG